ncbi:MAG: T9SS type A sorting domain-containing protein [Bacteroidales bacterium]|nr:T9SS type A sorting domain-containing protein [Bacteroidales bacterium]
MSTRLFHYNMPRLALLFTWFMCTQALARENQCQPYEPIMKAYPNPFTDSTCITLLAPGEAPDSICVFNGKGQKVTCLGKKTNTSGACSYTWQTKQNEQHIEQGMYLLPINLGAGFQYYKLLKK